MRWSLTLWLRLPWNSLCSAVLIWGNSISAYFSYLSLFLATRVWGMEVRLSGKWFYLLSHLTGPHWLARLAGQWGHGSYCLCLPGAGIASLHQTCLFPGVLGFEITLSCWNSKHLTRAPSALSLEIDCVSSRAQLCLCLCSGTPLRWAGKLQKETRLAVFPLLLAPKHLIPPLPSKSWDYFGLTKQNETKASTCEK